MYDYEASRGAGALSMTINSTGCGFDFQEMKYLIFSSLRCQGKVRH